MLRPLRGNLYSILFQGSFQNTKPRKDGLGVKDEPMVYPYNVFERYCTSGSVLGLQYKRPNRYQVIILLNFLLYHIMSRCINFQHVIMDMKQFQIKNSWRSGWKQELKKYLMQAIKYKRFYSSKRWKSSSLNGNCCGQSTFFNTYETRIEKIERSSIKKKNTVKQEVTLVT